MGRSRENENNRMKRASIRTQVHAQHLLDTSTENETLILPLLTVKRVPFPTIRRDIKCTTHHDIDIVAAAFNSESRQLVLCTAWVKGLHGTRAVVERFDKYAGSATVLCTHRAVISEVRGVGLQKGEVKVRTPVDDVGSEEEKSSTPELVMRVRDLLFELHGKFQFLDTPQAQAFLTTLRATNPDCDIPLEPASLSWFVAEVLPFSHSERLSLLMENSVPARLKAAAALIGRLLKDDMPLEQPKAAKANQLVTSGERVRYVKTGELAVVVAVHSGDPEGDYLTLRMGDGREKQTLLSRVERVEEQTLAQEEHVGDSGVPRIVFMPRAHQYEYTN